MIALSPELVVIIMFSLLLLLIFIGFPIGYALLGAALAVGFPVLGTKLFSIFYSQAFDFFTNYLWVAVPLFVLMGLSVEESGIVGALFDSLEIWLHRVPGNLAIVVVLTGTVVAACTGIIAGSVVLLGIAAMPHMMSRGYNKELASGAICASGCLGILIPPSVMLVIYGALVKISVGKLFMGAFGAGLTLSVLYVLYIVISCLVKPSLAPSIYDDTNLQISWGRKLYLLLVSVFPIAIIILAVLGVIFLGIASPTEAAATGAFATMILAVARRGLTWSGLKRIIIRCFKINGIMVVIVIAALCFMGVLVRTGGSAVVRDVLLAAPGGEWGFWAIVMVIVFILGMFMDWVGIVLIVLPLITPIAAEMGFDPVWFAMTVCVNFQMSFMTPPYAVGLYFLKEAIPDQYEVTLGHITRGVIPFIILVCVALALFIVFPEIITWLPSKMFGG